MKIILLKDVPKIGKKFEIKDLSDGYAQNFIIPRGLGMKATDSAVSSIKKQNNALVVKKQIDHNLLKKNLETLRNIPVTINAKANEKGHLFAGISKEDLVSYIKEQTRIEIDSSFIVLDRPIREVGSFFVDINAENIKDKFEVKVLAQ